jgi:phospholipase C
MTDGRVRSAARVRALLVAAGVASAAFAWSGPARGEQPARTTTPIEHFITLMQENHSFDNYFGTYPGADGIPPGTCMPRDPTDRSRGCVKPFHIGGRRVIDLDHRPQTHDAQFRGGKMDGFVYALGNRGELAAKAMGYYDDRDLPYYWNLADEYVLFDRFFTSASGGSVSNHLYWISGSPGVVTREREGIPETGWGNLPTIFDRLQKKGISWKFYIQNYNPRVTYRAPVVGDKGAQIVWAPLLAYDRYLDDPQLFSRIVDLNEFFDDLARGTLPAVSYIVPSGASEHPPGSVQAGERFVRTLLNALMASEEWWSSAFTWTYDDWGGWYDHVPPPRVDAFGYGFRAPALLVSPYAKRGHVDSTTLDFTSYLKFIEANWRLEPLAERDAKANNLLTAFDFESPPREPVFLSRDRVVETLARPRVGIVYAAYGMAVAVPVVLIAWAAARTRSPARRRSAGAGAADEESRA